MSIPFIRHPGSVQLGVRTHFEQAGSKPPASNEPDSIKPNDDPFWYQRREDFKKKNTCCDLPGATIQLYIANNSSSPACYKDAIANQLAVWLDDGIIDDAADIVISKDENGAKGIALYQR